MKIFSIKPCMHKNDYSKRESEGREKLMTIFLLFLPLLLLGGSGFLGQHIVRLIEERDPTVKEIRIVDLRPYENRLSK
jgi:hypothetical protein